MKTDSFKSFLLNITPNEPLPQYNHYIFTKKLYDLIISNLDRFKIRLHNSAVFPSDAYIGVAIKKTYTFEKYPVILTRVYHDYRNEHNTTKKFKDVLECNGKYSLRLPDDNHFEFDIESRTVTNINRIGSLILYQEKNIRPIAECGLFRITII